ncbi:MAG: enoyl-CoA hydratase/isomerase family protein [Acidobacteria bacterium]|nr:MAG: enoyl-CoA hydratase/isomerase family protein [Acidobacteriota bacterium]
MIELQENPDVLIMRFDQPEMRNPLSIEVVSKLHKILDRTPQDKKIIFTGTAEVFASGANLRELAKLKPDEAFSFARFGQSLMMKIAQRSSFAAINGFCFGGGLDLALSCKRRIAGFGAKFSHPGASLGIITGWGGTQLLPRLIGQKRALEMFLTAKQIDAREALRIGLVDEVVEFPLDYILEKIISLREGS